MLGSLLLLAAFLHVPTAYSAPGDPPSGSPAGAVYELPLEQGRADAAPKEGGAGSGGGTAPGSGSSLYRSENNFGSSSRVPGAAVAGSAAGGAGAAADVARGGDGRTNGEGGAAAGGDGGGGSNAGGTEADQVGDTGNTSVAAGVALLGAIGLLAAAVGVLSRRFS